jgi:hypothetical protein
MIRESPPRTLALVLAVVGMTINCAPTCEDRVTQEVLSPDRSYKVSVYSSLCGFNIASNTQVSILPANQSPHGRSNVFAVNASGGEATRGPHGGPAVSVRWLDNRSVEITYDSAGSVVRREERHKEFAVSYRPVGRGGR